MLGHYHLYYLQEYEVAVRHLRRAIRIAEGQTEPLDEEEAEAYQSAYRWLALAHGTYGHPTEAVAVAKAGRRLFPDDGVLDRILKRGGKI